jgi:hypothetical protein
MPFSSPAFPCKRLAAETHSVGMDRRDYDHSPLKPAPLRLPQKSRPSTPRTTLTTAGGTEPATPASHMSSQINGQNWSSLTPRRPKAHTIAGLVSKFEILDAMSEISAKTSVPSSPLRNPSKLGTPSSLGPGHTGLTADYHETTKDDGRRATIEGSLLGHDQVPLSSDQAVPRFLDLERTPEQRLLHKMSASALNTTGDGSGTRGSAMD